MDSKGGGVDQGARNPNLEEHSNPFQKKPKMQACINLVHAHFLTNNLNGLPNKMLGLN